MNNHVTTQLFVFTALDCEAKPLIRYFDLKKESIHQSFVIYKNNTIILTITGIGKIAMAGAVAYTLALFQYVQFPVLVNIGIAGHKTLATGSLSVAMKIVDNDSGKRFYPQFLAGGCPEMSTIKTISVPSDQYSSDFIYDMEASAFYEMAVRFSSSEFIHSFKIISDNESSSQEKINSKIVSEWIAKKMTEVECLINALLKQQESLVINEPDKYNEIVDNLYFTVSGKIKLRGLLMRWKVLTDDAKLTINIDKNSNGKGYLRQLENKLNSLEMYL